MPAINANGGGSVRGYRLPHARPAPKPPPPRPALPPILPAPPRHLPPHHVYGQSHNQPVGTGRSSSHAKFSTAAYNGATAAKGSQEAAARERLQILANSSRQARANLAKLIDPSKLDVYGGPLHDHHSGGGFSIASILPFLNPTTAVIKAYSEIPGIVGNTAKDALNLPKSTLVGIEGLGSAALDDFMHARLGSLNYGANALGGGPQHSETASLAHAAWHQSVIGHIARGDINGAWKTFKQHPLYGAQEFAGLYGLAGRGLGALARSGALGEKFAAAASTERGARELAPGLPGDVQHYSKNVITKAGQKTVEKNPAFQEKLYKATGRSKPRMLNKRIDEHVATSAAREQAAVHAAADLLKKEKPKGAAADVVTHAATGIAGPQRDFVQGLEQHLIDLKAAEAAHHSSIAKDVTAGRMSPAGLENNLENQANITKFLDHPDVQAAFGTTYATRRPELDVALARMGIIDPLAAERRVLTPYAQTQMEGAKIVPDKSVPTPRSLDARQAAKDVLDARRALIAAEKNHIKLTNAHGDAERQALLAERKLAQASKQEARTRGFLTGRYGQKRVQFYEGTEPPLHAPRKGLPAEAGSRLDQRFLAAYGAKGEHQSLKEALVTARGERRQTGLDAIAAAKENLKAAREEFTQVHKPYLHEKFGGLVTHDESAPLIRAGRFKGEQLRPLSNEEIRAHAAANGMDPLAYVRLNTPAESNRIIPTIMRRGGSRSKRYTGASVEKGTYTPGYGAIARSEIESTRQLQRAMSHDQFVRDSAVKRSDGSPIYVDKTTGPQAAADYEARTGVPVDLVPAHPQGITQVQQAIAKAEQGGGDWQAILESQLGPKDNLVMVPRTMVDRYLAHQNVLNSGNKLLMGVNRAFRNTVLPLSPKWLTGNVVEALGRGALKGAGPGDFALAGRVIKRMREAGLNDQADHLERMATGGLHYGMQHRLNMEQIGATGPSNAGHLARAAHTASGAYTHFAQAIFNVNRKMESSVEKAVLGAHMRRQVQEMTGTWSKAVLAQKNYVDKLAEGYADPRLAADAGRFIHDTLGQYDRFSPQMKRFVRSIAPFAPWYINAIKFVYHTLPHNHPLTQSVLLDVNRPIEEKWAKDHNVPHDKFFKQPTGDLLSALRVGPSAYENLGRYTPMGAFTSGPVDYGLNMVLPQAQGTYHALVGQDPFGNDLTTRHGKLTDTGQRMLVALNDILGEFAGPANVLDRVIAQHGSTPYNTSTFWNTQLKSNTHHGPSGVLGGLQRVFNPLQPTYLAKNATRGNGKGAKVIGPGAGVTKGKGVRVLGRGVK